MSFIRRLQNPRLRQGQNSEYRRVEEMVEVDIKVLLRLDVFGARALATKPLKSQSSHFWHTYLIYTLEYLIDEIC